MSNILIMAPWTPFAVSTSRGTGTANLLKASPKAVWQDSLNDGSDAHINIDLGGDALIDTVALIGTNAAAGAAWAITSGTAVENSYTASQRTVVPSPPLRAPSAAPQQFRPVVWPALHVAAAPFTARYIRVYVNQPGGAGAMQVGAVLAGLAFRPTWNKEWESGRGFIDTGTRTRLPDGGLAVVEGVAVPTYQWVLGDLSDDEIELLWALKRDRRTTRPTLVVEDPDATAGLAERIHYGTFTNIEAFSRRQASKSRWACQFEDWL